jgi:hypothetical protein
MNMGFLQRNILCVAFWIYASNANFPTIGVAANGKRSAESEIRAVVAADLIRMVNTELGPDTNIVVAANTNDLGIIYKRVDRVPALKIKICLCTF